MSTNLGVVGNPPVVGSDTVVHIDARRHSEHRVHRVIGRAAPDVTLHPTTLREGTLEVWCASYANAVAVENLHTNEATLYVQDAALGLHINYVCGGVALERDSTNPARWIVRVDFTEVAL